jgi:hypothetical protein
MKYLLTYAYEGKRRGERVSGQGSTVMTVTSTDKITPELINDAIEWVRNNFEEHTTIYAIAPMGWYKFDDEEGSDSK